MSIKPNSINNHTTYYYYYMKFIVKLIRDKMFNASRKYHSFKQKFPSSAEELEGLLEVVEQKYPHVCHDLNNYREFVKLIDDLRATSISNSELYVVTSIW